MDRSDPPNQGAQRPPRAVVIGGGFGGLSIAVRLQAAGVQVTLCEKRPQLGGRAYRLRDHGFTFDTGPSLIAAPGLLQSVFRAADRDMSDYVTLVPLDPYYRIYFPDGTTLDYVGDRDRMKAQMAAINAEDASRYDAFMDSVRPIYDAVMKDRWGTESFDSIPKTAQALPRLVRLGALRHVTDVVDRHFEDDRHRFLFSFHPLFIGGNPHRTPALYLMIPFLEQAGDVWFPRGGVYSLVDALSGLFRELGGEVRTGTEVTAITVEHGRAVGVEVGDEPLRADIVVSNADVGHTYGSLLDRESRHHWSDHRLEHLGYSMSCFILYIGVRRKYPQLRHHSLILDDHYDEQLEAIFDEKALSEDFSLWMHAPSVTDASMAPDGCETLILIVPVPNNESGIDWERESSAFADRVVDRLERWGLEDFRSNIEVIHTFTPDDFERELNATSGNAFSIEPRLGQTGWFRPHSRSEDVVGLYLVGAGTHPGAGVPGVLMTAEATYACIASDHNLTWAPDRHRPSSAAVEPGLPS